MTKKSNWRKRVKGTPRQRGTAFKLGSSGVKGSAKSCEYKPKVDGMVSLKDLEDEGLLRTNPKTHKMELTAKGKASITGEEEKPKEDEPCGFKELVKRPEMKKFFPDRVPSTIDNKGVAQNMAIMAERPRKQRVMVTLDRYFIEHENGKFEEYLASGFTMSKEHVERFEDKGDHAEFLAFFPESTVVGAKKYGKEKEQTIYDMGAEVGREKPTLVKMKIYYKDVFGIVDDFSGIPILYTNKDHVSSW